MGVTREKRDLSSLDVDPCDSGLISSLLEEPSTPSNPANESRLSSSKKSRKFRPRYWYVESTKAQKTKHGVRQTRRTDNLNQLLNMAQDLDVDDGEIDLLNLIEPSTSRFTELLLEQEKMKIWNDFVNRSEEQQTKLLNGMSWEEDDDVQEEADEDDWERVPRGETLEDKDADDKREVHPSFSAEECFRRIDSDLRGLLTKRHVPRGTLAHLEEEVSGFFKLWPSSIFVSQLPSSYERLLMHALCQYLDLCSKSFDDDHGVRQTQVENKHVEFLPPAQSLAEFLEKH